MTVLEELVEWSQDRPAWQRDALRRLVLNGDLSDDDIRTLAEPQDIVPLKKEHVPERVAAAAPVSMRR
ncbi:MAG: hypothetical protein HY696_12030 [Deltaproteobacteria bacterium]|nr:hypothetical protein [Deltaproteobacteria bacterium]